MPASRPAAHHHRSVQQSAKLQLGRYGQLPQLDTGRAVSYARPAALWKAQIVSASGWAWDKAAGTPAKQIVAATGSKAVAVMPLGVNRPDVSAYLGDPAAVASGFDSTVTVDSSSPVHLYALTSDGALHPLPGED